MLRNWKNWCRLCAKIGTSYEDDECKMESVTNELELVNKHFMTSIQPFDGTETLVCGDCCKFVIRMDGFRTRCMKTDEMFNELMLEENVSDFHIEFLRFKFGVDNEDMKCSENVAQVPEQGDDPLVEIDDLSILNHDDLDKENNSNEKMTDHKDEVTDDVDIESHPDPDAGGISDFEPDIAEEESMENKKKSENTIYTCNICSKTFKAETSMIEHIKIKHRPEELAYACSKCPKRFINKKRLTSHENTHLPKSKRILHACPHCDKQFKVKAYLKLHVNSFHLKGKQFVCEDCGNSYMNKHALAKHRISHTVIHACERCPGKTFKNRRRLLEHERTHDRSKYSWEKTRICAYCSKVFMRRVAMKDHLMTKHVKRGRTLACTQCPKRFATKRSLSFHQATHLPDAERRIHACPCCDKKFLNKNCVRVHVKAMHIKEKSFICEECGKSFGTRGILDEHKITHTDERPFQCSFCDKAFKNFKQLKQHESSHKKDGHECPHCGVRLKSQTTLRLHMVIHSDVKKFKCNQCGNEYKRSQTFKDHLISHTGQRPYQCPFCDKTFANGSNYRGHKRKAHPAEVAALEAAGKKILPQNIPKLEQLQPKH